MNRGKAPSPARASTYVKTNDAPRPVGTQGCCLRAKGACAPPTPTHHGARLYRELLVARADLRGDIVLAGSVRGDDRVAVLDRGLAGQAREAVGRGGGMQG